MTLGAPPSSCRGSWRSCLTLLGALALSLLTTPGWVTTARAAVEGSCLIIDSDAGLDDFRAVAALATLGPDVPARRIAAIIITEGLARIPQGAGAMETFLRNGGIQDVPVIQGIPLNPERRFRAEHPLPRSLPGWQSNTERLNGLLPEPVLPSDRGPGDVAVQLRPFTKDCHTITLLIIGPWTSFLRYAPDILERVERIVVQGRPYPDEAGGEPSGFNCTFDLDSCYAAFDLMVGRRLRGGRRVGTTWVDIPGSAEACASAEPGVNARGERIYAFRPIPAWADELDAAADRAEAQSGNGERVRVVREVARMLRKNPAELRATSLWDDLAALYLMRPEVFGIRGGHVEPCIPAAAVRSLLAEAMIRPAP